MILDLRSFLLPFIPAWCSVYVVFSYIPSNSPSNTSHLTCLIWYELDVLRFVLNNKPLSISNGNISSQLIPIPTDMSSYPSSNGRIRHHTPGSNLEKHSFSSALDNSWGLNCFLAESCCELFVASATSRFFRQELEPLEVFDNLFDLVDIFRLATRTCVVVMKCAKMEVVPFPFGFDYYCTAFCVEIKVPRPLHLFITTKIINTIDKTNNQMNKWIQIHKVTVNLQMAWDFLTLIIMIQTNLIFSIIWDIRFALSSIILHALVTK